MAAQHMVCRWYYAKAMETDEVYVFVCYDSREDGRARFTPHTSFDDPTCPPDAPERESIEIRAYAFWEITPVAASVGPKCCCGACMHMAALCLVAVCFICALGQFYRPQTVEMWLLKAVFKACSSFQMYKQHLVIWRHLVAGSGTMYVHYLAKVGMHCNH